MLARGRAYGRNTFLFLFIVVIFAASAFYARYYQLTNLTTEDAKVVVQGYLLTEEIEGKLITAKEGGSVEKVQPQLYDVSSLLVSYSNRQISNGLSVEGTR